MKHLKELLENVFYSQENRTISLSLEKAAADSDGETDIYGLMDQIKSALRSVGVDNVTFNPEKLAMTIITKEDKLDEIQKIANEFNAIIIGSGF